MVGKLWFKSTCHMEVRQTGLLSVMLNVLKELVCIETMVKLSVYFCSFCALEDQKGPYKLQNMICGLVNPATSLDNRLSIVAGVSKNT